MTASKIYLITKDLVETLERKIGIPLETETKIKIRSLENSFIGEFWPLIPKEIDKLSIDADEISKELGKRISKSNIPVVSLDRVYLPFATRYIEPTRLTNPITGEVKLGARPGTASLTEQIKSLEGYNELALADVGAFEGKTLLKLMNMLSEYKIKVPKIYLGISNPLAIQKINCVRQIDSISNMEIFEWIELRDLIGIDGRAVGIKEGIREFIPYWENLNEWASIPENNLYSATRLCKEYNEKLMNLLKEKDILPQSIGRAIRYWGMKI